MKIVATVPSLYPYACDYQTSPGCLPTSRGLFTLPTLKVLVQSGADLPDLFARRFGRCWDVRVQPS